MKKLKKLIIIFFISLFYIFVSHTFCETMNFSFNTYKGITVEFNKIFVDNINSLYTEEQEKGFNRSGRYEEYNEIIEIVNHLEKRMHDMEIYLDARKHLLPSCLNEALTKYLNDLFLGNKKLKIKWRLSRTEVEDTSLKVNASGGGESETRPKDKSKWYIQIFDTYKQKYRYNYKEGRDVLTASLLLHEFIHHVKDVCPLCFQILKGEKSKYYEKWGELYMEELSTQWGEVLVFGESNSATVYFDEKKPKDFDARKKNYCNYKIVCKCKEGCLEENE